MDANKCPIPPEGWECSRRPGHDGPCAALRRTPLEWEVSAAGRLISSSDFKHDVQLVVSGDFACDADRLSYAESLVRKLNAPDPAPAAEYCAQPHTCHCGTSTVQGGHSVGQSGCVRRLVEAPIPEGADHWIVEGRRVTDFTLREQRGYSRHFCGCWSRWPESRNSTDVD